MSFAASVERQQGAVFRTFGEDAEWQGVADPVRVIRREADEQLRFERSEIIAAGATLRVRRSEVGSPTEGQTVQILDADGDAVSGALFEVTGEPQLDRKGVWHCPVKSTS